MNMHNITKKIFYSFATAALLSAVGCSSDDDSVLKENSKIEISDFSISVAEGDTTLNFFAAANWRATLTTTSWINIDPTTKGGSKGESKIILKWDPNKGTKQRETTLTIAVDGENPVQFTITQLPSEPIVLVDRSESVLKVDRKAASGLGEFRDTLTVVSNIKWEVKETADWFEYEALGNVDPQEGVPTTIQLVVKGDAKKFNTPEMMADLLIGKAADVTFDQRISVKAIAEIGVFSSDSNEPLTQLVLRKDAKAGGRFLCRMDIRSNTSWEILDIPEWVSSTSTNNASEYAGNLSTQKAITFEMNEKNLDTEAMSQTIIFSDPKTGLQKEMELLFEGTGDDYFETKLSFPPDFIFDASLFDANWNPVEGAVMSMEFDMVSAKDYTSLEDAPFEFFYVHTNEISTYPQQVYWADVEMVQNQGRAALNTKRFNLYVHNRSDWEEGATEQRSAYMVVAPKGTAFEDLFDPITEELKEEYYLSSRLVRQKGIAKEPAEIFIPEQVEFESVGGIQLFEVRNMDNVSFKIDGEPIGAPGQWVSVNLKLDETMSGEAQVIAEENKTGEQRFCEVVATYYNNATEEEEVIHSFTVIQK